MRMSARSNSKSDTATVGFRGGAFVKLFDSLFVLRPTLMFPLWTMTLAGCSLAVSTSSTKVSYQQWALLVVAFSSIFGLVYLLNQYRDRISDLQNEKLFFLSERLLGALHLKIESLVLALVAPAALILSGYRHLGLWMLLIFAVAGILYNFAPLALQNRPWGGIIAGAVGGWLLLRLGGKIYGVSPDLISEIPYVIAFTSGCLLTELPDTEGDRASGKKTFSVSYGTSATIAAGLVGFISSAVAGLLLFDWVIALPAAAATPVLIVAWRRRSIDTAIQANKLAILLLSITAGVRFPVYLLVILLYFPFARWYHRRRFGLEYPSLKADQR